MNRREWLLTAVGAGLAGCGRSHRVEELRESGNPGINPERGFYRQVAAEMENDFASIRNQGSSLVLLTLDLKRYRDLPLTDAKLERLDVSLQSIREAGLKVIFRAAYGFTDDDYRADPMDLDLIRSHIKRMAEVLSKHAPVVWVVQAGMLGPWGEWHGSNHGVVPSLAARRCVVDAWLSSLPETTFLQVRRPRFLRDMDISPEHPNLVRVGWHNDAMLALPDDMGTYDEQGWCRERELEWSHVHNRLRPFGGETVPASETTEAEQIMREFNLLRISFLNRGYHEGTLKRWRQMEAKGGNLYDKVNGMLGYRWIIRSLHQSGGAGSASLEFENVGFAPLYSARKLEMAWLDQTSRIPVHPVVDCGLDLKGSCPESGKLKVQFRLPDAKPGSLLGLRLADPADSLREDGRYAIRLMNEGVRFHEASGWNIIG